MYIFFHEIFILILAKMITLNQPNIFLDSNINIDKSLYDDKIENLQRFQINVNDFPYYEISNMKIPDSNDFTFLDNFIKNISE